jgi:MFS family permease
MDKIKKPKIIVSIVCISFIQGLQYGVSPVLDQIQKHFPNVSISIIQTLVTGPSLVAMAAAVLSGLIITVISKKKILIFSGLFAGITGLLPFIAENFYLLFSSRMLYGISLGFTTALNTAVVAEFFEGNERVSVMGIQAASVGTGMLVITTLAGQLGVFGLQNAYYVNIIGFVSMAFIMLLLPETGPVKKNRTEKIKISKGVIKICFYGVLEFIFLITFTTNISLHLSGMGMGSNISGVLIGTFSGSQIFIGLVLGPVAKTFRKYTLPAAMVSFSIGAIMLVYFPLNVPLLIISSFLCGISQGIFIPQALNDISNIVKPEATALAAAFFTCSMCIGQLISPVALNSFSSLIFGFVSTRNVFMLAAVGMLISASFIRITSKKGEIV